MKDKITVLYMVVDQPHFVTCEVFLPKNTRSYGDDPPDEPEVNLLDIDPPNEKLWTKLELDVEFQNDVIERVIDRLEGQSEDAADAKRDREDS